MFIASRQLTKSNPLDAGCETASLFLTREDYYLLPMKENPLFSKVSFREI